MFVASPHVGIPALRSSLIASGISWTFIRCSAIRPVRILAGLRFFYSPLPLSFQLASLHHLHLRVLSVFSFLYLLLTLSSSSSPGGANSKCVCLYLTRVHCYPSIHHATYE